MPALAYRSTLPRPDDPDIIATVAEAVRNGHGFRAAAAMARVSRTALYDWHQAGLEELRTGELGSHAEIADAIEQGYADFERRNLAVIEEYKGKGQQRYMAAFIHMDKRNPEEWGQRQQVQVDQRTLGVNVSIVLGPESSEALAQLLQGRAQKLLPPPEADSREAT